MSLLNNRIVKGGKLTEWGLVGDKCHLKLFPVFFVVVSASVGPFMKFSELFD